MEITIKGTALELAEVLEIVQKHAITKQRNTEKDARVEKACNDFIAMQEAKKVKKSTELVGEDPCETSVGAEPEGEIHGESNH